MVLQYYDLNSVRSTSWYELGLFRIRNVENDFFFNPRARNGVLTPDQSSGVLAPQGYQKFIKNSKIVQSVRLY